MSQVIFLGLISVEIEMCMRSISVSFEKKKRKHQLVFKLDQSR